LYGKTVGGDGASFAGWEASFVADAAANRRRGLP
jgi:hypothetical protein